MLAALILQVVDRREADAVKVMIYLIEGVLPESYFANNLRGLSVDMAVFRDLLRLRLPALSRHLEALQHDARDAATGTSYEPPLTNVFTMQWFLTLFCNCLPQPAVLRVWDLVFLEGSEVLLRTALAIWDGLADRILAVESADEFYSIMGVLTREMLEFGLMDTNNLVKTIVAVAPFPFPGLPELRDKYLYNITPWTHSVQSAARRGLRGLFYSDDDDDEEESEEDEDRIAVAAAYGLSAVFRSPRRKAFALNLGTTFNLDVIDSLSVNMLRSDQDKADDDGNEMGNNEDEAGNVMSDREAEQM
ncbi:TBC1 domain family member 30 [Gryllus bimaculatus]|nr:TBC1 domain family member 30 [Gryllus bimaculatus]